MNERDDVPHLSDTATLWSVVRRAHQGPADVAASAREQLLLQYREPVSRYLLGALRDADAAAELFQEFALHFLRGDFHRADPERGRFRAYIKTALFRMVVGHYRRQQGRPGPLPDHLDEEQGCPSPGAPELSDSEEAFARGWRNSLLTRAWEGLAQLEERTGQPVHTVLRFRVEHPDLPSAQMAEQLGAQSGRPLTVAAARQALYRAREKFSNLLLDLVAQTLEEPTADRLAEELLDLGLLDYCRPALDRLRRQEPSREEAP